MTTHAIGDLVRAISVDGPGMTRAAARLMTRLENEPHRLPELYQAVAELDGSRQAPLARLMPRVVLGITGAPGSGKSTLADALVREYRGAVPTGVSASLPSTLRRRSQAARCWATGSG